MFTKSEKKPEATIDLSGAELSKLTGEELVKIFASVPESVTTLDLSNLGAPVVQNIKQILQMLDDVDIPEKGQKQSEANTGPK